MLVRWTVGLESLPFKTLAVGLSLAAAAASYRFVEQPVRASARLRQWPLAARIGVFVLLVGTGWGVGQAPLTHQRALGLGQPSRQAADWYGEGRLLKTTLAHQRQCDPVVEHAAVGAAAQGLTLFDPQACTARAAAQLFVIGDSHATAYLPLLEHEAGAPDGESRTGPQLVRLRRDMPHADPLRQARALPPAATMPSASTSDDRAGACSPVRPGEGSMIKTSISRVRLARLACIGAASLWTCASASAQLASEWEPPLMEILQLPPYCQGAFRKELDTPTNPIKTCGGWFNHFCPGLVALNRAAQYSRPMSERRTSMKSAVDHLQYTRKNLSPTCALAGEVAAAEARAKIIAMGVK